MPCSAVMRRSSRKKAGRRRDEAAFAEHRFDDDRRDAVGGHDAVEDFVERSQRIFGGNAVAIAGKRRVVDLAAERPEVLLVRRVLTGHRQRQQRASVVTVGERDDGRPPRVFARDLDRVLGRLGAGREQQRLFGGSAGSATVELFGDAKVRLVHRDLKARVREPLRLLRRSLRRPAGWRARR